MAMEKNKNKVEGENETLQKEVKEIHAAFTEGDKRRKMAEAALSESQAKNTDDTAKIQDLSSHNDKLKVCICGCDEVGEVDSTCIICHYTCTIDMKSIQVVYAL